MNKGNDILKTALGVMSGVVAGNMISNAITASAISSALEDMQTNMDNIPDQHMYADSGMGASGGDDFSLDI